MNFTSRFSEALSLAATLHADQQRKVSDVPYLAHLLAVAALVMEHGGDEDECIAALLHDAVEDQGGMAVREEICRRFGETVVSIIDGCTDATETPKPAWRQRKEAHIARLRQAPAPVRLVTAADKLHNVRCIVCEYRRGGESLWRHFRGGRDGTLWYYRAVTDTLKHTGITPLVAELDRTVTEMERWTLPF